MTVRRKTPGELLLNAIPVALGAVVGYVGAAAAVGPGTLRIVLTVVFFAVSALLVGFGVDHLNGHRRGAASEE